eukprot:TRINITY_DN4096_c0_g1_i5.p1 TRINITY_DN4096_c0_g1~~TRINITY_DN4096_c0_g1_i5.p1  ORF type:complete len:801 (-),score=194.78 TRINITY_DN4096_c0_g1_i5:1812-4214(-)
MTLPDEQLAELGALESIFVDGFKPIDLEAGKFVLHVVPFVGQQLLNFVSVDLQFELPALYPNSPPDIAIVAAENLEQVLQDRLLAKLQDEARSQLGDAMIYNLAQIAVEFLQGQNVPAGSVASPIVLQDRDDQVRQHLTALTPFHIEPYTSAEQMHYTQHYTLAPNMSWSAVQSVGSVPPMQSHVETARYGTSEVFVLRGREAQTHLFDTVTAKWREGCLLPRATGATATMFNSQLLLVGGEQTKLSMSRCGELDNSRVNGVKRKFYVPLLAAAPHKGESEAVPRTGHTTVSAQIGLVVFGGQTLQGVALNDLMLFAEHSQHWNPCYQAVSGTAPAARHDHSACIVGYKMYIYGGRDGRSVSKQAVFDDMWTLDMMRSDGVWHWSRCSPGGSIPSRRYHHSMEVANDRMILFGGTDGTRCLNDLYIYSTISNMWGRVIVDGMTPSPRSCHSACMVAGKMYIFGGVTAQQTSSSDVFVLHNVMDEEELQFSLPLDLAALLKPDARYLDCELVAAGARFSLHQCILEARCPALFSLVEAAPRRCYVVHELSQLGMCEVIKYLYTDSCDLTEDLALEIAPWAARYLLERLERICQSIIARAKHQRRLEEELAVPNAFQTKFTPVDIPDGTLDADMVHLLTNSRSYDVVLQCEDVTIPAHAVILTQRCAFFRAMLQSGLIESATRVLTVREISSAVARHLLRFLYGSTAPPAADIAVQTVLAADLYSLPILKRQAEFVCSQYIEVDNCCMLLLMAEQHQTPRLRQLCVLFAARELEAVRETEDWAMLPENIQREIVLKQQSIKK